MAELADAPDSNPGVERRESSNLSSRTCDNPSRQKYKTKVCRCAGCTKLHRDYEREAARRRRRPDSGWNNGFVDPQEVQDHLQFLALNGVSTMMISERTGLNYANLTKIRSGRATKVTNNIASKILAQGVHHYPEKDLKAVTWAKKREGLQHPDNSHST